MIADICSKRELEKDFSSVVGGFGYLSEVAEWSVEVDLTEILYSAT